jgi:two-component sensor histidine kinase
MNGKLSIFLLVLLWHQYAWSQAADRENVDSLKMALTRHSNDSNKVNTYAKLMFAYVYHLPETGIEWGKPAMELAQQLNWLPGIAKINHRTGRLYWRLGKFDEALKHHTLALQQYEQVGNKHGCGRVLIELAQDYIDNGKLIEAKQALFKSRQYNEAINDAINLANTYDILCYLYDLEGNPAEATKAAIQYLKLSEKTGDKYAMAHGVHMLGANYRAMDNLAEAMKYFKKGLQITREIEDQIESLLFYVEIGEIYMIEKNYDESYRYLTIANNLSIALKDQQFIGAANRNLGHFYKATNKPQEAIFHYQKALAAYQSISYKQDMASLYSNMGDVYTDLNDLNSSKKMFDSAKLLFKRISGTPLMIDYYNGKQKLDSSLGNWQSAYLHYKNYITVRDSAYSQESYKKIIGAQLQFEQEKKDAARTAEQERKDLLAKEEIKRQRNIRNVSFAVLLMVAAFSVFAYRQRNKLAREKKRSDQLLADKELLLREIHHRVKNNLEVVSSLLALQSAQIGDTQTKDAMQESQNRVQSIGIVHQKLYQGTNLGAIEMKDYFLNLSESILDSFGADKRVTIECAMEKLDVDIDTAVPLGLIVNELLTNTLKYAFPEGQPGKVLIKLQKQNNGVLKLEVSDNGVGKSGITHGTGFGGQLVSLLTQQLSGTMKEEVNDGTKIYFEFKTGKAA